MHVFCEVMAKDILPGIRAMIAKKLINDYGMSQTKVAYLLSITQPAISQYTRSIRGNRRNLVENKIIMKAVDEISSKLNSGDLNRQGLIEELSDLCIKLHNDEEIVTKEYNINA